MRNAFKKLSAADREAFKAAYVKYLHERNGAPNFDAHTSTKREAFFAEIDGKPVLASEKARLDQEKFQRNQTLPEPEADLDERTLWAVCTANANLTEDYGVNYGFKVKSMTDPNEPYSWVQIEENYHTRLLADAVRTLGVEMVKYPPKFTTRALLHVLVQLPYYFSNVLIFCAEACGIVVFRGLQYKARELFQDEPEALARIDSLFDQIMVDEVGHLRWVHSQMGQIRLSITRTILPWIARAFLRDLPDVCRLLGREEILRQVGEVVRTGVVEIGDGRVHPIDVLTGQASASDEEVAELMAFKAVA